MPWTEHGGSSADGCGGKGAATWMQRRAAGPSSRHAQMLVCLGVCLCVFECASLSLDLLTSLCDLPFLSSLWCRFPLTLVCIRGNLHCRLGVEDESVCMTLRMARFVMTLSTVVRQLQTQRLRYSMLLPNCMLLGGSLWGVGFSLFCCWRDAWPVFAWLFVSVICIALIVVLWLFCLFCWFVCLFLPWAQTSSARCSSCWTRAFPFASSTSSHAPLCPSQMRTCTAQQLALGECVEWDGAETH